MRSKKDESAPWWVAVKCVFTLFSLERENFRYDTLRVSPIDIYMQEIEITSAELVKLL